MVIPHYDHLDQFQRMLPGLVEQGIPLIVVDDASPRAVYGELKQLLANHASGSTLVRHSENSGKGAAVITGFNTAIEAGFTHALQIDADGQHDLAAISELVTVAGAKPASIVCGEPVFDRSISRLRFYARYITLYFVWLETLSTRIRDAMCGLRIYPLEQALRLVENRNTGMRMTFDTEILVLASWAGISLQFVPVKIVYPAHGKSHFHYFSDNLEISWMHTRLIIGMLLRIPGIVRQNRSQRTESLL